MPMTGYDRYLLKLQEHFPIVTANIVVGENGQEDNDSAIIDEYRKIARKHILREEEKYGI